MSWMSPSYLLQSEFNTSWTPLASRYSLWLYREVGWEPSQVSSNTFQPDESFPNEPGNGFARPVHSRKCGIIAPGALNSVVCC